MTLDEEIQLVLGMSSTPTDDELDFLCFEGDINYLFDTPDISHLSTEQQNHFLRIILKAYEHIELNV